MTEDYDDSKYKRCPKCEGSGTIGECVKMFFGNMFIDVECPRCKGQCYIEVKPHKKSKK